MKFISPFISSRLSSETKHPSPTLLKHKPCPSGHKTVVLDNDRGSTLFPHDISLENKNFCAMDILEAPILETVENDSTVEHESFYFWTPHVSCSILKSPEIALLQTLCFYKEHNHPLILVVKIFRRMVVDTYVYHKYCKSRSGIVVLHYSLNDNDECLVVKLGTTPLYSLWTKFPRSSLRP